MSMTLSEINNKEAIIAIENLPVINAQKEFDDILKNNDIFDPANDSRFSYRRHWSQYVYSINNKDVFIVPNYYSHIAYLRIFYEQQQIDEKAVYISEASEAGWLLKLKVTINNDQATKNLSEKQTNELLDATNLKTALNRTNTLITFFEDQQDLSSDKSKWRKNFSKNTKIERIAWKRNWNEAGNILELLSNVQESLTNIENNRYTWGQSPDEIRQTITQHSALLTDLERVKTDFLSQSGDINEQHIDSVSYYPISTNTPRQAEALKKILKEESKQFALLNQQEISAAQRILLLQDLEALDNYLDDIIINPDKTDRKPFKPLHSADFALLVSLDPTLKAFFVDNKTNAVWNNAVTTEWAEVKTDAKWEKTEWAEAKNNGPYTSGSDAFKRWWTRWATEYWLDQTGMSPGQKQFWRWASNVAVIWGMAILGWQVLSHALKLFTKEWRAKWENRAWVLAPLGIMWVYQWMSGKNPRDLLNSWAGISWIIDIFTGKKTWAESVEQQTYAQWFPVVSALFAGKTYGDIKKDIEQKDWKMTLKKESRERIIAEFKLSWDKTKTEMADFLEKSNENDLNDMIDLWLNGMWADWNKLNDIANDKTQFSEIAAESIIRLWSINKFMNDKWYDTINPEQTQSVKDYVAKTGATEADLQVLADRGDVFEKASELPSVEDQEKIQSKIDALNITDLKQKGQLTNALKRFYMQRPKTGKTTTDFDISINKTNANNIDIKTYDQTTSINLNNKTLVWFNDSKAFGSTLELIKATNLVNRIKNLDIVKNKKIVEAPAFDISSFGKDIEANDTKLWSTSADTEIISAWGNWSLKKISPNLEDNKLDFVAYLNKWYDWYSVDAVSGA